jgi:hypothetical protein
VPARYRSASFAEYALGHVSRLLGTKIVADITEISVLRYQEDGLREKAAPKSINEEVRFLRKMLGDPGEVIRCVCIGFSMLLRNGWDASSKPCLISA